MPDSVAVDVAGGLLIVAGIAFLVIELHVAGFGIAGLAGAALLVAGGMLIWDIGPLPETSRPLLVGAAIGTALFSALGAWKVVRARRVPPHVPPTLVGAEGVATSDIDPVGTVRVRSEEWTAESKKGRIAAGSRVLVVEEEGLRLHVDPAK
jgi:membrane-bound serine protease (ClpP class)